MICTYCKRDNAEYHFFTIRSNEVVLVHVCKSCKQDMNLEEKTQELGNDLDHLLDSLLHPADTLDQQDPELICDRCGTTLKEFKRTNFLGCANCYNVFTSSIEHIYSENYERASERSNQSSNQRSNQRYHKRSDQSRDERTGLKKEERITRKTDRALQDSDEKIIAMMMKDLKEAVRLENFEKAAEIRDRIRSFKKREPIQ